LYSEGAGLNPGLAAGYGLQLNHKISDLITMFARV
jgi:hypothetical protein